MEAIYFDCTNISMFLCVHGVFVGQYTIVYFFLLLFLSKYWPCACNAKEADLKAICKGKGKGKVRDLL